MSDRIRISSLSLLLGLLTCLSTLGVQPVQAQSETSTLTGVVVDAETGEPLPGAHVFIARTMQGTATDDEGRFRLSGIAPGAKRLYVSMMGFAPANVPLVLPRDAARPFRVQLRPRVIESEGVVVEAKRSPEWTLNLERFREGFIGRSRLSSDCDLQNPEVLRFETTEDGILRATAARPLVIVNRALGYRIRYFLESFEAKNGFFRWTGEPTFEALTPRSEGQRTTWARNRRLAYNGSLRHFLRSLIEDTLDETGFAVKALPDSLERADLGDARPFPVDREELLTRLPDSTHALIFDGWLEVRYEREAESRHYLRWTRRTVPGRRPFQYSYLRKNRSVVRLDPSGETLSPFGLTVYNYFSFEERIAYFLPLGYTPDSGAS